MLAVLIPNTYSMEKSVKSVGVTLPNELLCYVHSNKDLDGDVLSITFECLIEDVELLSIVKDSLTGDRFVESMRRFVVSDREGNVNEYDTSGSWSEPSFDNGLMSFTCWGSAFIAESVAEMFELYLFSIEGVNFSTISAGSIEDQWLSRGY